jgi:hypothetical protein
MPNDDHESASELADRGRSLMLGLLVIFCAISAISGFMQLSSGGAKPAVVPLVRFGLSVLVAYFVYKGSVAARIIFAILCVLGALASFYYAVLLLTADLQSTGAATLLLWGGFYLLAAWAPWSRPVQAYWTSLHPEPTDRDS